MPRKTLRICTVDFNWVRSSPLEKSTMVGMAHEFADADPVAYAEWQLQIGANLIYQHAFTFDGCAWYPTRLGPMAPQAQNGFFDRLIERSRSAGALLGAYMNVGQDRYICAARPQWLVPTSAQYHHPGFLAPESEWTSLLCRRIEEFLSLYPVDAMLFDWFVYGTTHDRLFPVQPSPFLSRPFREIIGREMPESAADITAEESLCYQREVLARQFYRIRDAVKGTHQECRIMFNVPFWKPNDPKWTDHPIVKESDWLFAECSQMDVVGWLLDVRRPEQRVFTTIISGTDKRHDPERWRVLHDMGCDLCGWGFPDPATGFPGPWYDSDLKIVRDAFLEVREAEKGQ